MTRLYHGSEKLVERPWLGGGNPHNDYGPGFYCTKRLDLAGEWACKRGGDGFVNEYAFDMGKLNILDLLSGDYTVLHWIALLMANRTVSPHSRIGRSNKEFLIQNFLPDTNDVDVVIGYRADDSYFSYAEDFVNNNLSVHDLGAALRLGNLGTQTALISQKAFDSLRFEKAIPVLARDYATSYLRRDRLAREAYAGDRKYYGDDPDQIIATDIVRGAVSCDDPRIPRMLS